MAAGRQNQSGRGPHHARHVKKGGSAWEREQKRRVAETSGAQAAAAAAVGRRTGWPADRRRVGMVRCRGLTLALCLYHAGLDTFTTAVDLEGSQQPVGVPLRRLPLRRLQADTLYTTNATNATNVTKSLFSECEQAIRRRVGIEQCEIDYRSNDCPDAANKNWVAWVDLTGGVYFAHIFGVLVMFMALSVVCDEFFVPGTPSPRRTTRVSRSRPRLVHYPQ